MPKIGRTTWICLLLAAATLAVYWQVGNFEFTNYDEINTIVRNPIVRAGITLRGLWWGLTTTWFDFWHPTVWWSHELDCQLFGLNAGWHHLMNLAFHVANTLLLFILLQRMTNAPWRSAMVAALFALHPLHVESVAWIAERKDTLSTFFFLFTLLAYVAHVERLKLVGTLRCDVPGARGPVFGAPVGEGARAQKKDRARERTAQRAVPTEVGTLRCDVPARVQKRAELDATNSGAPGESVDAPAIAPPDAARTAQRAVPTVQGMPHRVLAAVCPYQLSLIFFALGLMSKSMLVTTPCVLLLLDYWPLGRSPKDPAVTLLREKIPFFALSLASCAVTWIGMRGEAKVFSAEAVPWGLRVANALVAYARYLGKTFWPAHLAAVYETPAHWPILQVIGAAAVLALISLAVFTLARRAPYLVFGWLMFLGTLVPVIGIVAMSRESMADRYMYIPSIGLFVAIVWGIADAVSFFGNPNRNLNPNLPRPGLASVSPGGPLIIGMTAASILVLGACSRLTWVQAGYWRSSFTLWSHCLEVEPNNVFANYNLGCTLQDAGKLDAALARFQKALKFQPDHLSALLNEGVIFGMQGRMREATNCFERSFRIKPGVGTIFDSNHESKAHRNMALALIGLHDFDHAVEHGREAVRLDPTDVNAEIALARALGGQGKFDEAMRAYSDALNLDRNNASAYYYLGLELMNVGQFDRAASCLGEAVRLYPSWTDARQALDRARKAAHL